MAFSQPVASFLWRGIDATCESAAICPFAADVSLISLPPASLVSLGSIQDESSNWSWPPATPVRPWSDDDPSEESVHSECGSSPSVDDDDEISSPECRQPLPFDLNLLPPVEDEDD